MPGYLKHTNVNIDLRLISGAIGIRVLKSLDLPDTVATCVELSHTVYLALAFSTPPSVDASAPYPAATLRLPSAILVPLKPLNPEIPANTAQSSRYER